MTLIKIRGKVGARTFGPKTTLQSTEPRARSLLYVRIIFCTQFMNPRSSSHRSLQIFLKFYMKSIFCNRFEVIDKFFGQKNPLIFTILNFGFCFPNECSWGKYLFRPPTTVEKIFSEIRMLLITFSFIWIFFCK